MRDPAGKGRAWIAPSRRREVTTEEAGREFDIALTFAVLATTLGAGMRGSVSITVR